MDLWATIASGEMGNVRAGVPEMKTCEGSAACRGKYLNGNRQSNSRRRSPYQEWSRLRRKESWPSIRNWPESNFFGEDEGEMGIGEWYCWELGYHVMLHRELRWTRMCCDTVGKGTQAELAELNLPKIMVWTMSRAGGLRLQEKKKKPKNIKG